MEGGAKSPCHRQAAYQEVSGQTGQQGPCLQQPIEQRLQLLRRDIVRHIQLRSCVLGRRIQGTRSAITKTWTS